MIQPDTKDWTWVLERHCDECGFDAATVARHDIGRLLRENAAAWRPVLARSDVAIRPDEATWSPLEYACHVRDVFRLFAQRLALMLADAFDAVPDDAWRRTGTRSDGARFTIETFATYLVHDPTHHLWDVTREPA